MKYEIENDYLLYVIGDDGKNLHFIDKKSGIDYCSQNPSTACTKIKIDGQYIEASSASYSDGKLTLSFGETQFNAVISVKSKKHYLIFDVVSISKNSVGNPLSNLQLKEFTFANIDLTLKTATDESFSACAMALNLKTNVVTIPQPTNILQAMCYPRFGFCGAQVAIIGCPQNELRSVMKEVISDSTELPKSSIGGPYALDAEINRGSYMFNFGGMSEATVDDWISLAKKIGINQIDFHGGNSFRFGDCRPNPETYPNGLVSFKAVIDKLHEAGILAGLHTYAFFIDKNCPWVTPVPDPHLAKDATFTLAESLALEDTKIPVVESTQNMSTITGFFVRNSVTIQIDDELIIYKGLSKDQPYAFTDCQRGAYGTKSASHTTGAKVHHLKECFGLFVPDPETTLFEDVAGSTANMYNECGFDMMYLDALDGEDILGGGENGWHYGSKYVFELWKRIKKSAIMEMSTFHHHLWFVRARMGAWDHPTRSHKRFIDVHCESNESVKRMFLPGHLGWWAVKTWSGPQGEPTFADDIEYLCCKCIGNDVGFSIMGIDPSNISKVPVYERLAEIMRQYEELRRSNYFSDQVKSKLKVPGDEFTLIKNDDEWKFQSVQYAKHKVEGINGWSNVWAVDNRFDRQPLKLRIEALMSTGSYDSPDSILIADFANPSSFSERLNAQGISSKLESSTEDSANGIYSATNNNPTPIGSWAKMGKNLSGLNLSGHQALGVWVNGDGQGEVLNFQLKSPEHISGGIGEHYVIIDFTGWRYFELIEPEGERYAQYSWHYGGAYAIYRESISYNNIESLNLWFNNVPVGKTAKCQIKPIKALPLVNGKIINPAITIGDKTIVFPVEIESGFYLEFNSMSDCKLYGQKGELLKEIIPQGEIPILDKSNSKIKFACNTPNNISARANVTIISKGNFI
ncbi:MAG: hypothetical protein AAB116_22090 [Candidatus Poribacteria bacterium]